MTAHSDLSEGACLCGAVRFTVALPVKWCAHCHCTMCQRAHGAPLVTWVGIPRERFTLVAGEALRWHRSSAAAERGFCGVCGSSLLFRSERWPDEVHVARANLGAIDRDPAGHVFWDSHAPWLRIDDGLPRFGGPSGTAPLAG